MSNFTKLAIIESFIRLSKEMPIEKITVTKITEKCGINRNTFYYYYQDVYALLEEIIYTKAKKLFVIDEENLADSWKSNLRFIGEYARKNENFIKSVYQSMGRDAFGDYLVDISYESVYQTIKMICSEKNISDESMRSTSYIMSKMFAETAVEWIRGKIDTDPVKIMEKAIVSMDGVAEIILENFENSKSKDKYS